MRYLYQDAERFINDVYWSETHDPRSHLSIADTVASKLLADHNEHDPDYYNQKNGVIHASSVYGCVRGLIYEAIGYEATKPTDARQLGIFKAGNLFEDFIIDSLGEKVLERQREYSMQYKSLTIVGRSDYRVDDEGVMRIGENKSVHSDSFWYRKNEGTLVAWQNQIQLQIYMWMERELFGNQWEGIFSYISKDDCTVSSAPVKYNPRIIEEVVKPILDMVNEAYVRTVELTKQRRELIAAGLSAEEIETKIRDIVNEVAPSPALAAYSSQRSQYQVNWLAKYCGHHDHCAGKGWVLEAQDEVRRLNLEAKKGAPGAMASAVRAVKGE